MCVKAKTFLHLCGGIILFQSFLYVTPSLYESLSLRDLWKASVFSREKTPSIVCVCVHVCIFVFILQRGALGMWLSVQSKTAPIIMTAHYLPCSHIKIYFYIPGDITSLLIYITIMAHFIGLFGAVEKVQNAFSCKNGLGDRQVGKLTTAAHHILLTCVLWLASLPVSLFIIFLLYQWVARLSAVWLAGRTVE